MSTRLAQILKEKEEAESQRQKLFTQAKDLHDEILRIKEKRREHWWKKYSEARKIGSQMEERQTALRTELDSLHRKIIGSIIRRQPLVTGVKDEPSRRANYKISIIRLRHEIEDLKRRVEAMDIKVETEVRLRNQAEREVKTLRQEVSRKKANVALSQSRVSLLRSASSVPPDLLVRM
ncbi:spermatogenesis-associated C-terminus [Halocaridina rubra]|uniref:Spermatogenesis-associated C-terminus n=1 Tax=Halocaridina rubra TaxID=373956 RepID=A0AAN8WU23_HALRR